MKKDFPSAGRLSEGPRDGYFKARLNRSFTARQRFRGYWRWTALGALLLLALANGCAMQPPTTQSSFSGPRLVVTMTYRGNPLTSNGINPYYYYFFVINYAVKSPGSSTLNLAGNKQAPGPVPVVSPQPGLNGFVIGSDGSTYGFSDYVEYNSSQPFGYELYHVNHNNPNNLQEYTTVQEGAPARYVSPINGEGQTSNQLQFTIYLSQLIQAATGESLAQANTQAQQQIVHYLQINIISTNTLNPSGTKMTDSLGIGAPDTFLNLDLTTLASISNSSVPLEVQEPSYNDVVTVNGSGQDGSLDLTDWSIQYFQN